MLTGTTTEPRISATKSIVLFSTFKCTTNLHIMWINVMEPFIYIKLKFTYNIYFNMFDLCQIQSIEQEKGITMIFQQNSVVPVFNLDI